MFRLTPICWYYSNQDGRLYPEFCEKLGDNERGVGVLIIPQSVLACFRSHSLSLSLTVNHNQGNLLNKMSDLFFIRKLFTY